MITEKQQKLITALNTAQLEANKFIDHPDTGTCNLDTVCIWLADKFTKKQLDEIGKIGTRNTSGVFRGSRFVFFDCPGIAARRTKMMEVAMESLRSSGYTVAVWYQMD